MTPPPETQKPTTVVSAEPQPEPSTPRPDEEPEQDDAALCDGGHIGHCRAHATALLDQVYASETSAGDQQALRERAYGAFERACALRGLTNERLGWQDTQNMSPEERHAWRQAALREAPEHSMIGVTHTGPEVPAASAELGEYLQRHPSEFVACIRTFSDIAERRAKAPRMPPPRGVVRVGQVSTNGNLDSAAVADAAWALEKQLLRCYAGGLQHNPNLEGRVSLRVIFLDATGEPFTVNNAGSDLPDRAVVQCTEREAYDLRVPAGAQGTAVVPVLFAPPGLTAQPGR